MLVLSRKINERILIGEDVVITLVRTGIDKVRLGIDAPRGVRIVREELTAQPEKSTPDQGTSATT